MLAVYRGCAVFRLTFVSSTLPGCEFAERGLSRVLPSRQISGFRFFRYHLQIYHPNAICTYRGPHGPRQQHAKEAYRRMHRAPTALPPMDSVARVKSLYYIMQSMEGKLGGGEGVEGLYGSITRSGMQKVLDCLSKSCGLDSGSHLVDIGAGLGRPLLHALVHPGVASGFGIEIDRIKCEKAAAFLRYTVRELQKRARLAEDAIPVPKVQCSSIEKVASLEPATHAYSFWEGVPVEGKCAFGRLFAESRTMQSVAVVQRAMRGCDPADEMEEMGFGRLLLVSSFAVSMSGSGRSFRAYVFTRVTPLPAQLPCSEPSHLLPATPSAAEGRRLSVESNDSTATVEAAVPATAGSPDACAAAEVELAKHASSTEGLPTPMPETPAAHLRQPGAPAVTPSTAARLRALSHLTGSPAKALTPSGVSGPPMRVALAAAASNQSPRRRTWLAESRAQDARSAAAASKAAAATKPAAASKAAGDRKAPAQENLGTKPSMQGQKTIKGDTNAKPTSIASKRAPAKKKASPKKGVQKAQSPKKTLEANGFRSKRAAAGKSAKGLNFATQPQVIEARGLGQITEGTTAQ